MNAWFKGMRCWIFLSCVDKKLNYTPEKKKDKNSLEVHDLWKSPEKKKKLRERVVLSRVSRQRGHNIAFVARMEEDGKKTVRWDGGACRNWSRCITTTGHALTSETRCHLTAVLDPGIARRAATQRRDDAMLQARQECSLKSFLFRRITRLRAASLFRYLTLLRWPLSSERSSLCRVEIRTTIEAWLRAMQIKLGFVY